MGHDDIDHDAIRRRIVRRRKALGLSQKAVAARILNSRGEPMSERMYQRWESGASTRYVRRITDVAEALQTDVSQLAPELDDGRRDVGVLASRLDQTEETLAEIREQQAAILEALQALEGDLVGRAREAARELLRSAPDGPSNPEADDSPTE